MIEVDKGIYVDKVEVCAIEDHKYWRSASPSDTGYMFTDGSVIVLKNGRKIYCKLTATEVMGKLK